MALRCTLVLLLSSITFTSIDGIGSFHRGAPALPRADYGMAIGAWNNTISIFGGEDYKRSYVEYDIAANSIIDFGDTFIPSGSTYGSSSFFTQMDRYLYSIDYYGQRFIRFDLVTQTSEYNWKSLAIPTRVYHTACLASTNQYLFVVGGGTTSGSPKKNVQILNLTSPISSLSWITGPALNEGRSRSTCAVHPSTNRLYVMGGLDSATIESINVASGAVISVETWSYNANDLLIQTRAPSSIIWAEDIYIIGGYDYHYSTGDNFLNMLQIFNPAAGTVTLSGTTLDFGTMSAAAVRVGQIIYVFGGAPYASPVVQHSANWQWCDLLATRPPTTSPTKAPTNHPTVPTAIPTMYPTVPTVNPTIPTSVPTRSPSTDPTTSPTNYPTTPTANPTASTVHPSTMPSNQPTNGPTNDPTDSPTGDPTKSPTDPPTRYPTKDPTDNPTRGPTRHPITGQPSSPTAKPTISPSGDPTVTPTMNPTKEPTNDPTISPVTPAPTDNPTRLPTRTPTLSPSADPSTGPTTPPPTKNPLGDGQTADPTESPTQVPTKPPTFPPTVSPTSFPTKPGDTKYPTVSPTAPPSTVPTAWPVCIDETIQFGAISMKIFIEISVATREMKIVLTAPENRWFGIGFGGNTMDKTPALTIASSSGDSDSMALTPRGLQHHAKGTVVPNALDNIPARTVVGSSRVVTISKSWTMDGIFDFTDFFDGARCDLPIIWAVGLDNALELSNHGPNNRGSVTLRSCMCSKDPTGVPTTVAPTVSPTEDVDGESDDAHYVKWSFGALLVVLCSTFASF